MLLCCVLQPLEPKWHLYNAAGLYWWLLGDALQSIDCFLKAYIEAIDIDRTRMLLNGVQMTSLKDAPLVNLVCVLYKQGFLEDAITILRKAYEHDPQVVSD